MMAQPWDVHDGFQTPSSAMGSSSDRPFDEDLFSAALLFLDHRESSDSDSFSTNTTEIEAQHTQAQRPPRYPQSQQQQQQQQLWQTLDEDDVNYDRSLLHVQLKVPRTSYESSPSQAASSAWSNGDVNAGVPMWSPSDAGASRATPRRVNKRREEINLLRTQAHVLQARLDALHMQPLSNTDEDGGPMISAALGSAWQSVASRQLEQRNRAESENRRLKGLVAEHKRTAKALKRLMARHANAKSWDQFRPSPPLPDLPPEKALALEDPGIFDVLLASLEPMAGQTDSILANVTVPNTPTIKNERHGNSHVTVRYSNSRVVPFGVAETTAAVWNYMLVHEEPRTYEWTQLSEDTYKGQFASYTRLGDCEGHAKGKLVLRRVNEPHRTIFIRSAMFHTLSTPSNNQFLNAPLRHFEWTVVDKPASLGSQSGQDKICRIVTCSVAIPRLDDGALSDESRDAEVEEIEEMCSSISMYQWDEASKIVDNLLLNGDNDLTRNSIARSSQSSSDQSV